MGVFNKDHTTGRSEATVLEFVGIIERQLNNYFCRKIACSNY